MSKFDDSIELYKKSFTEKLKRKKFDEALLVAIAKSLGPSIYNKDAAKVSCSDKNERLKIKKSFLIKKLGLTDDPSLDEAIIEVCQEMGTSNRNKYRPVFYYLLVEKFNKQDLYITPQKATDTASKSSASKASSAKGTSKSNAEAIDTPKVKSKKASTSKSKTKKEKKSKSRSKKDEAININTTAETIINRHALFAAGAGLIPIPLIDLVTISAVQYEMIQKLAKEHDHVVFKEQKAKSVIAGIMGGIGSFEAGLFTRILFKGIPFFGPIIGGTAVSGFAYYSTKLIGEIFDDHFSSGGTMAVEDITMQKMKEKFKFDMKQWKNSKKST